MEFIQQTSIEIAGGGDQLATPDVATPLQPEMAVEDSVVSDRQPENRVQQIRGEIAEIFQTETPVDQSPETTVTEEAPPSISEVQSQVLPKKSRLDSVKEAVRLERSLTLRGVRPADIDQLVAADIKAFSAVYDYNGMTAEELREDLTGKFMGRIDMLGDRFIRVLEKDGMIVGSIMACPTSKPPEGFISWEDTTDNGTLKTTYDPTGEYLYVVSLATTPESSGIGGSDMLMANMIGRIIGGDYQAYFESRVPGLRGWVLKQCRKNKTSLKDLNQDDLDAYAQQYFELTTTVDNKTVPFDPLLRIYESMGCSFVKIVPDAYQDPKSLNFGVVCHYNNPLPAALRRIPGMPQLYGKAIGAISHSNWLTRKVF